MRDADACPTSIALCSGGALETAMVPAHLRRLQALLGPLDVHCVCTEGALTFVTPAALTGLTQNPVSRPGVDFCPVTMQPFHLKLSRVPLVVVYPASPRLIVELALGSITCPVTRLVAFARRRARVVVTPYLHPDLDPRLYTTHLEALSAAGVKVVAHPAEPVPGVWNVESAWLATERELADALTTLAM